MKTIVWDVDDVLNDLMRDWFESCWRPSHADTRIRYEDITENPPDRVLGISRADYLLSLDEFRRTELARLCSVSDVAAWFGSHGHKCRHLALTAVPLAAAPASASWVLQHFGRWIRSFNVVPSLRGYEQAPTNCFSTKKEFFQWLDRRGLIFVDDSEANISMALDLGISALLMPRPWNSSAKTISDTLDHLGRILEE